MAGNAEDDVKVQRFSYSGFFLSFQRSSSRSIAKRRSRPKSASSSRLWTIFSKSYNFDVFLKGVGGTKITKRANLYEWKSV